MYPETYNINGFHRRDAIATNDVIDIADVIEISSDEADDEMPPVHQPLHESQVKVEAPNEQLNDGSNDTIPFGDFIAEENNFTHNPPPETISPKSHSGRLSRPSVSSGIGSTRSHPSDDDYLDAPSPSGVLNLNQDMPGASTAKVMYSTKSKPLSALGINKPPPIDMFDDAENDSLSHNVRNSTSSTQNLGTKNEGDSFNHDNYADANPFPNQFSHYSAQHCSNIEHSFFPTPTRSSFNSGMTPNYGGQTPIHADIEDLVVRTMDKIMDSDVMNKRIDIEMEKRLDGKVVLSKEDLEKMINEIRSEIRNEIRNEKSSKRHSSNDRSSSKKPKYESNHTSKSRKTEKSTKTTSTITSGRYESDRENFKFNLNSTKHVDYKYQMTDKFQTGNSH